MEEYSVYLFLIVMVYGLWLFFQFGVYVFFNRKISISILFTKIIREFYFRKYQLEVNKILTDFNYYKNLPEELKLIFIRRVLNFIITKEFIPRKIEKITFEHKVRIASAAIQLSFGMDQYLLKHFSKIYIFPKPYFSYHKKEYHKGEINLSGAIVLSYDDFQKGYNDSNDGINLGLHEMAHALRFNSLLGQENDELFNFYYTTLKSHAKHDYIALNNKSQSILRDYAKSNFEEFFSVCIENFFERPNLLKNEFPELYNNLKILLNQNPENSNPIIGSPRNENYKNESIEFNPDKILFVSIPFSSNIFIPIYPLILIAAILFMFFYNHIVFDIVLFSILVFFLLLLNKRYYVFENGIVIKPLILSKFIAREFDFNKIESLIYTETNMKEINIRYIEQNKIISRRYKWGNTNDDFFELIQKLEKLKVKMICKKVIN